MKVRFVIDRLTIEGIDLSPVERKRFMAALHSSLESSLKTRFETRCESGLTSASIATEQAHMSLRRPANGAHAGMRLGEALGMQVLSGMSSPGSKR
jgi:hypothetical protein